MTEPERIADQIERAHAGDPWHGESVARVLADVTAAESVARPLSNAHTIREIVDHMTVWLEVVRRRLGGEPYSPATDDEDWPPTTHGDPRAWTAARRALQSAAQELAAAARALPAARLDRPMVPGGTVSAYVQLHGAVQHSLHHLGQIVMLKKGLRVRAGTRPAGQVGGQPSR